MVAVPSHDFLRHGCRLPVARLRDVGDTAGNLLIGFRVIIAGLVDGCGRFSVAERHRVALIVDVLVDLCLVRSEMPVWLMVAADPIDLIDDRWRRCRCRHW